jgi:hypothetical protein
MMYYSATPPYVAYRALIKGVSHDQLIPGSLLEHVREGSGEPGLRGCPKPIQTSTFIIGIVNAGVNCIRFINFGMKQHLEDLPRGRLECNAVQIGYPENEYEISMSRRTPFLFLMKVISPYSPNITINQFPEVCVYTVYYILCVFLSQLIYLEACMCIFLALYWNYFVEVS